MEIHLKRDEIAQYFTSQIPENLTSKEEQEYLNALLMVIPALLARKHKINNVTKRAVHGLLDSYFGKIEILIAEKNRGN